MPGKKILLTVGSLMAFASGSAAYADCWLGNCSTGCMSVPCGWYLEAGVGSSHISDVDYPGDDSRSGIGGQAAVGYKFMPYLGLELGGILYQNTSIEYANVRLATVKNFSFDLAFKGILPFADSGFELFAKLGLGRMYAKLDIKSNRRALADSIGLGESTTSRTGMFYSFGAQYYLMPEFAIFAQWSHAQGGDRVGNMELLSAGVSFILD